MVTNTEINDIAQRGLRKRGIPGFGLPDAELDQLLLSIGCTRVDHQTDDRIVVYYMDDNGTEQWVICAPNEFSDSE